MCISSGPINCGSKVIQFAKNAPLNALIILARDERFLFQVYFSKGGPLDDFSKKIPFGYFFVAKLSLSPS